MAGVFADEGSAWGHSVMQSKGVFDPIILPSKLYIFYSIFRKANNLAISTTLVNDIFATRLVIRVKYTSDIIHCIKCRIYMIRYVRYQCICTSDLWCNEYYRKLVHLELEAATFTTSSSKRTDIH